MFLRPKLVSNITNLLLESRLKFFINKPSWNRNSNSLIKLARFNLFASGLRLALARLQTTTIRKTSPRVPILSLIAIKSLSKMSTSILEEADKLFEDSKYDELASFLQKQPNWDSNEHILWRLARCQFQQSKSKPDAKAKAELINSAYENVKKSLAINDKVGAAQKWAAILLEASATLKGTKERVLQVLNIRTHMEKAVEYSPDDATSYYLLGEWHFSCYQVSWWERKLASIAFGTLPEADMSEALRLFEKAEEVEPDFYSKNKLMLAKTLLELKRDKDKAVALLKEIGSKYSNSDKWDDKEACEEAKKLLAGL